MEEEAEKLMAENLSKNFIDYEEYPQSVELCVSLLCVMYSLLLPKHILILESLCKHDRSTLSCPYA